jgi:hypothetical protein
MSEERNDLAFIAETENEFLAFFWKKRPYRPVSLLRGARVVCEPNGWQY